MSEAAHPVHRHVPARQRLGPPFRRRECVVVQEAQRQGMRLGIRALQAGAAEHHIHAVVQHIGPDAVPEQLHRALVAIGLEHAGAAELQKALAGVGGEQRRDVELAFRVEAGVALRHLLTQQAIGADDLRLAALSLAERAGGRVVVDDEQVVADGVIGVDVALLQAGHHVGDGRHFLMEYAVTQLLRAPDVLPARREPDFQRANPSQRRAEAGRLAALGLPDKGLRQQDRAGAPLQPREDLEAERRERAALAWCWYGGERVCGGFARVGRGCHAWTGPSRAVASERVARRSLAARWSRVEHRSRTLL